MESGTTMKISGLLVKILPAIQQMVWGPFREPNSSSHWQGVVGQPDEAPHKLMFLLLAAMHLLVYHNGKRDLQTSSI